jgi:hypothetical protein
MNRYLLKAANINFKINEAVQPSDGDNVPVSSRIKHHMWLLALPLQSRSALELEI